MQPITSQEAREWTRPFPHHPVFWTVVAAVIVFALTRSANTPAPVVATDPQAPTSAADAIDRAEQVRQYVWLSKRSRTKYEPLAARIAPPEGFHRVTVTDDSFAHWLRFLPCRAADEPVRDGRDKAVVPAESPTLAAVIDLHPAGPKYLRSGNMIIRLRAEYLWSAGRAAEAEFSFTSGDAFPWQRYSKGERPVIRGSAVTWSPGNLSGAGRGLYVGYMETLFRYSSRISLVRDTHAAGMSASADGISVAAGDVLATDKRDGHAVIVLDVVRDVVRDDRGVQRVLIGQGGEPAVTFHVLRDSNGSAWFPVTRDGAVIAPGQKPLPWKNLRRWPEPRVDDADAHPPA